MAVISQYLDIIGTNYLIQALKKWQSDKLDNYVTLNTAQTIIGTKTFQASIKSSTSGANIEWGNIKIFGAGSKGGSDSIRIGDDVTIGDCNISGSFGMVSTGANAGFRFFNSSKASIGGIQSTNGILQWFTGSELKDILHAGNSYIKGSTITINGSSITPLTSLPSHTHDYLIVNTADTNKFNSSYHDFQVLYAGGSNGIEGRPEGVDAFGLFRFRVAYGWSGQMLLANGGDLYIRSAADESLNKSLAWKRVIDSGNVGLQSVAYASKAGNADTVDGVHMDWSTNYTEGDYLAIWDNKGNCIRSIPKGSTSVGYASKAGSVAWDSITGKPSSFTPSVHNHDGRYLRLDGSDTMTGVLKVKGNQYNDGYDGAINMNNSNIYGLNSIYTSDRSDSQSEGFHFWRDATHVDTLRMMDGSLLFIPNRPLGGSGTEQTVLHTGNSYIKGGVITINGSSLTPLTSLPSHTHSWDSITDKIVAGNEFNIVNAGFNSGMWFNFLPINDRNKIATITSYHFGNGQKEYASVTASGFVKKGSNSSYVLLGDGGHKTISSLSVNYASSAGNADTTDNVHIKWAGELTSTNHLVAWEADGSALRDIKPSNVSVGNSDKVDNYHIADESRQIYKYDYTVTSPAGSWVLIKFPAWNAVNEIIAIDGYGDNRQAHCVVHCGSRDQGIWGYQSDYNGTVVDKIRWRENDSGKYAIVALINGGITTLKIRSTNSLEISKTSEDTNAFVITSSFFSSSGVFHGKVDWGNITGKPSSFVPSAHEHNYILDIGSSSHTTFAYSKPGLSKDSITWLAVWNGYELRAMNKDQISLSGHTHDDRYLKLEGGTMNGNARIGHGSGNLYIGNSGNDGWLAVQDICSQDSIGEGNWSIRVDGTAHFQTIKFPSSRLIAQVSNGSNSPLKGIKLPNLQSNAIGLFSRVGNGSDEGGIILSEDTCVIYNSFDTGWGLSVRDKDLNQTDISSDDTVAFGIRETYKLYSRGGFEKKDSSDDYVLLGGGGHSKITDLSVSNADKLDGVHLNGIFTAFGNNGHNITATIGGVTKSFLVNWAADSGKLDGLRSTSFAPYNGVKFGHSPDSNVWHQILQFTTNWVGQVTFMYSPEECQRDYWGIFNINIRSKDIWFQGFNLANLPEMKCVGDDSNNWSVWVKGNANSYDPYGTIQVLNFTNATIKSVGLSKSQANAPSGTYAKSPTILSAGKVHNVTLWGQAFDGTNSVSGSLSNTGTITASKAATYDIGSNSLDYRYGYFQWIGSKSDTNLRLAANDSDNQIVLHTNGNVGVGTNGPSYKLHVAGIIYTSSEFKGPYARLTDQNGAVVIGNSTNARLSAIDQHVIFNTGGAIRFGETNWDWNQWAGLKYTHSDKTIYLGIADGTIFTANSGQKGGTLKFPNVSTIEACSIRIEYTNEINSYSGDLYLNHRGNGGSNGNTANIRMLNNGGDLFLGGQLKFTASEAHIGCSSDYSDPWLGLDSNFKFGGNLAATHIYSNGGFHKNGSDDSYVLLGGGGHALISDLGSLSSRRLLSNSEFAKGNNFLQYFNFVPNSTSAIGNAGPTVSEWYHIIRMNHGNNAGFFVELAAHFYDKGVFYRSVANGSVNTNWKRFLTHNGTIAFTSFNTYYEDGIFDMDGNPNGASNLLSDSWNQTIINLGASFSKARIKQLAFNYSDDTIKYRRRGDSGWTTAKTIAFTDSTVSASNLAYTLYGKYTSNGGQQKPDYFGKNRVGALMMNTSVNGDAHYKDWLLMDCYSWNDAGGGVAFGVNRQTLGAYIMRSNSDRGSWAESAELVGTHNFRRIFRQFYPSGGSDVIDVNYPLWVAYLSENSFLTAPNNSSTSTNSSTGAVTQYNYETRWVPIAEGSEYCSFLLTLEDTENSRANVYNFIVSTGHSSGEIHQLSTNDYGGVVRLHLMLRYSGQNWVLYLAASTTISNPTVGSTGGFTYGNSKYIAWIHVYLNTVLKGSPTLLTINDLCNKHRIPGTPASYGNSKPITPYFRNTNTDPTSSLTYEKTGGWSYKMLSPCPIKGATSEKTEFKSPSGKSSYIVIDPTITIPSTSYSSYETVLGYQGIKTYNINVAHINADQLEVNTSANFTNSVYLTGVLYGLRVGVTAIWENQTKKISDYKSIIFMYKTSTETSQSNKTSTIVLDDTRSGRMIWVKNTTNNELYIKPASGTIILEGRNYVHTADNVLNLHSVGDGMMFIFCPGAGSVGSVHYTVGVWEGFKHPRDW